MNKNIIDSFRGEYAFLSNFYEFSFVYKESHWKTAEHAFQAMKFDCYRSDIDYRSKRDLRYSIWMAETPKLARKIGNRKTKLFDKDKWEQIKDGVMREILDKKFYYLILRNKLLDTGDMILIEGNDWGDTYWGVCNGVGENRLGKILMEIRNGVRNGF